MVTSIRNFLFDVGILKSFGFNQPVIAVGNLSVGGTGKTPQIEYLIRLLSNQCRIAVLSRGYKRKSKGFVLGNELSDASSMGDEPFQYYQKFPKILVAVDTDRKNGIEQLLAMKPKPAVILLDDAFQHRRVRAGFYILLSTFSDLYVNDFLLPTGNLRESRAGADRAHVVIVTKCPANLGLSIQMQIKQKLNLLNHQKLFFSTIVYDDFIYGSNEKIAVKDLLKQEKLILAGIAKPKPFVDFLKNTDDEVLIFPDHHHFSDDDILEIQKKSIGKIIITTEKDFVRLKDSVLKNNLYFLPIKTKFINIQQDFDATVEAFVAGF